MWREDIRLMTRAGVNLVSLGIFSWGLVEVADGEYRWNDFDDRDPAWPEGWEVSTWQSDDATFVFYLNHADQPATVATSGTELLSGEAVAGSLTIPAGDVRVVIRRSRRCPTNAPTTTSQLIPGQ